MLNRNSKLLLATLAINNAAQAALNDTGITTCSNATQNGLPCPVAGFPGQDAEFGTNKFNFTKLDANGNAMPVTATNHVCVKDNVTGLIWEVNTYTATFDAAPDLATEANTVKRCGHTDWRVPDLKELASIVDYSISYPGPTIDEEYFPNTPNDWFWSASPNADYANYAWIVGFDNGYDYDGSRSYAYRVRLVCERQVFAFWSLTDVGDGTIKDNNTGLLWAKCPVGLSGANCATGSASSLTWAQALAAGQNLTLGSCNTWRLPNIQELRSIADYSTYSPSIATTYFPNTPSNYFWSASPSADNTKYAWVVGFYYGYVGYDGRYGTNHVRLVCKRQASDPPLNNKAALESPQQNSYESGIGLIRGWACQANKVEFKIDDGVMRDIPYGSNRGDTESVCGDKNNGFGFTYNWNNLTNGTHTIKLFIDGTEVATANFTTTNLGVPYLQGASGECEVSDFPEFGDTTNLRWSEPHQNFVIVP